MATLDPRSDVIVIRVVYDGAPLAGKSTSVRALGRGVGGEVFSPAETDGRTLYFDWLDYTGGLFEGRQIRCQIVSVPGQAMLAVRRRRLLESADAIVFVGDSTPAGFAADRAYLRGLNSVLEPMRPPVGIVFQANKRDSPDAIPIETVRSMLEELGLRVGVIESVATEGSGIREAFVFAVRLALDRVRELMRNGEFVTAPPIVDSAQDLLKKLKRGEAGGDEQVDSSELIHTRLTDVRPDSILATAVREVAQREQINVDRATEGGKEITFAARAAAFLQPATPDDKVATGMVWPPVDGRVVLHELAQTEISPVRSDKGDWTATANRRWRLFSLANAVYSDVEKGRSVLVQAARVLAARERSNLPPPCLALAADGHGRVRLWIIERLPTEPSTRI
jgi:signal recognition particle receptor subunit beta